jgi:hypothetical protein
MISAIASGFYYLSGYNSQVTIGSSFPINFLGYNLGTFTFGSDMLIGLLIFVGIIATSIGIAVFGSGLSTFAQAVIYKTLFYYGLYGILSVFSLSTLFTIPIVGSAFWCILTLCYVVGVQQQIGTHTT